MNESWLEQFPELKNLGDGDRAYLVGNAMEVDLPPETTIFSPGAPAQSFLLVLEGVVKVQQVSSGGREIVLYRVAGGESCIMTMACLLSQDTYSAEGVTETGVRAVSLPKSVFDDLMASSPEFRAFVFSNYSARISDLLHLVEEVAFQRIDTRLAHKLLERSEPGNRVAATHQELATELGTAREVVSRHIKEFERRGWLTASRGHVDLTNREALQHLVKNAQT